VPLWVWRLGPLRCAHNGTNPDAVLASYLQNGVFFGQAAEGPDLVLLRWPTTRGARPVRSASADSILLTCVSSTRRMTNRLSVLASPIGLGRSMESDMRA
jgi:hypothetical protein